MTNPTRIKAIEGIIKKSEPFRYCPPEYLSQPIELCILDLATKIDEAIRDKEICICAAVKTTDGDIIRGHRHGDCFYAIVRMGKEISPEVNSQGFVTSKNRYVDREDGARLQREAGVISVWTKAPIKNTLFSEDLY